MTTTHPIDPTTNLPELPEGHFWRVEKDTQWETDKFNLSIVKEEPVETSRGWFREKLLKTKETRFRTTKIYEIYEVDGKSAWSSKKDEPTDVPKRFHRDRYTYSDEAFYIDYSLSRDTILATANRIMDIWSKEQAKKKAEDELLGDYPPRKL